MRGRTDESPSRRWPHEAKSVRPGASERNASLTSKELETLRDWNKWDLKLYAEAKRIAASTRTDYVQSGGDSEATTVMDTPSSDITQCASNLETSGQNPLPE